MDTGNTLPEGQTLTEYAVQPRGYGEHLHAKLLIFYQHGSAPWIRGTLLIYCINKHKLRFNPVDTGNTGVFEVVIMLLAVQPRGYGEHRKAGTTS